MNARNVQPFRWFGSKTRLAGDILSYVPQGKRIWVELFAGSGVVTLLKEPHFQEHLNDLDGDVVNVFRVLRDPELSERLIEALMLTPFAEAEFRASLTDPAGVDAVERARRFLVQCWQGQGGVSRHKTGFRFSTVANTDPAKCWSRLPERLQHIARRLRRITVWSRPALKLFAKFAANPETVVFADPPYPAHTISAKPRYRVDMSDQDHVDMAEAFKAARCAVILTMNPGTVYEQVLSSWHRAELNVRGTNNEVKTELLLSNVPRRVLGPLFETRR